MTREPWSRRATWDRGSSAVEFALVMPLLLLMLFGIIDFGRLTYERINVTAAAYEGARNSGLKGTLTTVTAAAQAASGGLSIVVTGTTQLGCPTPGVETTVTVARPSPFRFYTPFLRAINTTVTSTGAFRCLG